MDVTELEDRLRTALERHPEVLVAYLFGSAARGRPGPLSDVDVAVLLAEDREGAGRALDLIGDLAAAAATDDVDLVVLNEAPRASAAASRRERMVDAEVLRLRLRELDLVALAERLARFLV